ncbi:hypothetical protein FKD06_11400 [Serratia sp. SRS-8-S-2018]|uniref:helix-turn-helix transcriptional regulator n=1 Tax=Serratia sp. SRS-8-S-2018 TaxID=2591107 RepID=UPI0011406402|nr:LuxR C-terminal-related transcriptional regulator [Serratia sp. SRS-8-S-2018]TPW51366.1 hypothetical protein FKD06_11400 [Serratia sp. SRS-8-S-2018]
MVNSPREEKSAVPARDVETGQAPCSSSIVVVDACPYGRLGLQRVLMQPALTPHPMMVETFGCVSPALSPERRAGGSPGKGDAARCLVVRLSPAPALAVMQLLQLAGASLTLAGFQRLVILSPFVVNNAVRQILVCCAVRVPIRIVNARCPAMLLRHAVLSQGALLQGALLHAGRDEELPQIPAMTLSAREREVLLTTLQEISIHQQARRQNRNHKTLYAQRKNALKKMRVAGVVQLLRRFMSM